MGEQIKNVLVSGIVRRALGKVARRYLGGRLIDIGCGTKPYAGMVRPFVTEHIGVDHPETRHDTASVDLFASAYDIPVAEGSFDCALSTAVLEHLEEPECALKECYRVLKPGGVAVYTVPFIWHVHERPRDFYRYSEYGLRYLFEDKAGFEIVQLDALSGFWVTFGQLFTYNIDRFNRGLLKRSRVVDMIELAVQAGSFVLDQIDRTEQWTWMYLVIARKPGGPSRNGEPVSGSENPGTRAGPRP